MSDFSKIPNLTLGTDPSPYRKRIAELERELAEARKDSERLEFLFRRIIPKTDKGEDAFATYHCAYSNRQAIDNEMKEHAQNEH